MPNKRGSVQGELERAHPFPPGRFDQPEPQEARGQPGSRGVGPTARHRDRPPAGPRQGSRHPHTAGDWTGVNPEEPIDPAMPRMKPGDQAG